MKLIDKKFVCPWLVQEGLMKGFCEDCFKDASIS